ncbi:uncharacterized membrane protein HdeD (DUF308 family) [Streptomyces canus]|uniref:Uncharacterized membrane protein HdeD (DUF308 family) n=1 Tax=Streptomyces canus TaxID=58343 RepID=A0AAW8FK11_9ACTN|nr:DUF308 domain-containing protein [Streptomyces canus]MDQ0909415.1 uncharacterized membrane protein HdeD (DUF308 family) [Streptomyces canus]
MCRSPSKGEGRRAVRARAARRLILGVLVLVLVRPSLLAAGVLVGVHLLIGGAFQLVAALGTLPHDDGPARPCPHQRRPSILLGLFCLRGPMRSILLLALGIGIGIVRLIRGITRSRSSSARSPSPPGSS